MVGGNCGVNSWSRPPQCMDWDEAVKSGWERGWVEFSLYLRLGGYHGYALSLLICLSAGIEMQNCHSLDDDANVHYSDNYLK